MLFAGLGSPRGEWRWCSLWARQERSEQMTAVLGEWPIDRPANWTELVKRATRTERDGANSS